MAKPQKLQRLSVGSLGGTITMVRSSQAAAMPTLTAADLTEAVPALSEFAEVEAATLYSVPSAALQTPQVLAAAEWARNKATSGQAVVLVQGTDTLEETAYLLDLQWPETRPLVITGAMRTPSQPGADGPANLLSSALVALAPQSYGRGVLVVMNDEIHAATRVRKTDAISTSAFSSGRFGVIGRVHENAVTYAAPPQRWAALPPIPAQVNPRVALLETYLGDNGDLLRMLISERYDGVVLSAFGAGHVSPSMADAVSDALEAFPVVLATRTGGGTLLQNTYGFKGSETDLLERGAIPAGWLDARKARILLWSLIAAGASKEETRDVILSRGSEICGIPGSDATLLLTSHKV